MTFKVHGFLDDKKVLHQRMEHLPRTGDTMRMAGERYAVVTEICWVMDEPDTPAFEGQRINMRMRSIASDKTTLAPQSRIDEMRNILA
jgi:hypothetical protein